ncbi:ribosome maturation factor RimP [Pelagibaculum spongiae]|uniref:Ribosome maturation factor RimP n=1 Tax=Pelagibaculum spongiae TaxID=2080658 RepID=A0A2V1H1E2_9GAMM|nr:ribosome maturation factor RimP [Pelagibaculum spongiae]PVZ71780.1 ribosome maturation factor RimP [Pelagibaculum spongiae]
MAKSADRLQTMVQPSVEALGFEFVGLDYRAQGRHSLLRIYIDAEQGINVDDCALVSRQVSAVLDVEDPITGEYTLEVSSPGIERPLFTAEHYRAYVGERLEIRTTVPVDGRRNFVGTLAAADDDAVDVEIDGQVYKLALIQIDRARLKPQF